MERINVLTSDITQDNIGLLSELFPSVATEVVDSNGNVATVIDFDELRELLGDVAEGSRERYRFTWPGKQASKEEARTPTANTMRPVPDESKDWDNTNNLYIEGDNFEALKLLRSTYAGKIQLIYIDPPYNTGSDSFLYPDSYVQSQEEYDDIDGALDEYGYQLTENRETYGKFHSVWCSMINQRLLLARDLLSSEGAIFISIDEREHDSLKKIADEVFGRENYQATLDIQVRYGSKRLTEEKAFQPMLEYILVYSKNRAQYTPNQPVEEYGLEKFVFEVTELEPGERFMVGNQEVEVFKKGQWQAVKHKQGALSLLKETWISGSVYTNMSYGQVFQRVVEPRVAADGLGCLYKVFGRGEDGLGYRYYTGPAREGSTRGKMFSGVPLERANAISNDQVSLKKKPIQCFYDFSADFGNIRHEGGIPFNSGKKPVKLLKQIINYCADPNAIVLDFFAGSSSTAHAVMELNAEDGGARTFIMVQIPEKIADKTILEFGDIARLGEERIRRAGAKIVAEVEETNRQLKIGEEPKPIPDVGFRVLRIDSSNFTDTHATPDAYDQGQLHLFEDNVKPDRSDLDLLFQVLPTLRIPYSAKIEEIEVCGKRAFDVNHGQLVACFDVGVGADCIEQIAKMRPIYAVFRDASMADDATEANFEELFKTFSPDTVRKVI